MYRSRVIKRSTGKPGEGRTPYHGSAMLGDHKLQLLVKHRGQDQHDHPKRGTGKNVLQ